MFHQSENSNCDFVGRFAGSPLGIIQGRLPDGPSKWKAINPQLLTKLAGSYGSTAFRNLVLLRSNCLSRDFEFFPSCNRRRKACAICFAAACSPLSYAVAYPTKNESWSHKCDSSSLRGTFTLSGFRSAMWAIAMLADRPAWHHWSAGAVGFSRPNPCERNFLRRPSQSRIDKVRSPVRPTGSPPSKLPPKRALRVSPPHRSHGSLRFPSAGL